MSVHHATAGQPRPARNRRCRYTDRCGISRHARARGGCVTGCTRQSAGDVRPRAGLAVHLPVPIACRPDAWRLGAVEISTLATNACIAGMAALLIWLVGPRPVPAGPGPDHPDRGHGGRVAVLYSSTSSRRPTGQKAGSGTTRTPSCTGSSHYDLPRSCNGSPVISAFTTCIICRARCRFYRLPEVLRDIPAPCRKRTGSASAKASDA